MHSPEKDKFHHLNPAEDDSRVDPSFIHEHDREIRNISSLVSNFKSKTEEDLGSGKRRDWTDAFNNNFTPIFSGCDLIGIAYRECEAVKKLEIEIENNAIFENREISDEEKEKIYELVDKIGVVLNSILK